MGNKKRFLVDSNIIIGAEKGNRYCRRTLLAAGSFRFLVTKEVAKELGVNSVSLHVKEILAGDVPLDFQGPDRLRKQSHQGTGVRGCGPFAGGTGKPPRKGTAFNAAAMKAYI